MIKTQLLFIIAFLWLSFYRVEKIFPSDLEGEWAVSRENDGGQITIDSLIFDFNNDGIKDKILIRANPKEEEIMGNEYFDHIGSYYRTLDVLVGKNNNSYTQVASNKNIIPCLRCNEPMRSYSDFKRIGTNSFSVDVIQKADNTIYQLVFEWMQDQFYLKQVEVKSFYDENGKTIKLKHFININDIKITNISEYISQK